jgi:hypothetical protein
MKAKSIDSSDVARRLWERAAGDATAPEEIAAAISRVCAQLSAGLGRWIGAEGYRALLDRSIILMRGQHPSLDSVSCVGGDEMMTAAAVRAYGARAIVEDVEALLATVIELLGRIIGDEMAVRLVEQLGIPSPRGVAGAETDGEGDG